MTGDVNSAVGGVLSDLASIQTSPQKTFGYKRAAAAILSLERMLQPEEETTATLQTIPGIGPASARVIFEMLHVGVSQTVEDAVAQSGRIADVRRRRELRHTF